MLPFFKKQRKYREKPFPPIAPDRPFTAFGDLHGRADLLEKALSRDWGGTLVFVGDYIDRGPQSAAVLELLKSRRDIITLAGNHEQMMLGFLADPTGRGPNWLRNGGQATLASFGINSGEGSLEPGKLEGAAQALRVAMGQDLINWLQTRPALWKTGNVCVVHAGADPALPMTEQITRTLLWGHDDFHKVTRTDGVWVVHGHKIVPGPRSINGRISIDTGAYATGELTGAQVSDGKVDFATVTV